MLQKVEIIFRPLFIGILELTNYGMKQKTDFCVFFGQLAPPLVTTRMISFLARLIPIRSVTMKKCQL